MPELPEVETIKRALEPAITGKTVQTVTLNRPDLRFPIPPNFAAMVEKQRITATRRRGKYILIDLANDYTIILHLGMSGRITILPRPESPNAQDYEARKHDHVLIRLEDGTLVIFNDPRRFGMLLLNAPGQPLTQHKLFKTMGPEPLSNELSGPALEKRLQGKTCTIKAALLDQRVVCGVGNIYACEALFGSGIDPETKAGTITGTRAEDLCAAIKSALTRAIEAGGSSLRDYAIRTAPLAISRPCSRSTAARTSPAPPAPRPLSA